jgi:phosphoribosylcarboxyaminoimidazole (NCAIR) mutase
MPPGIPVATVAIGSMGSKNAAYLAIRIMALSDAKLKKQVLAHKEDMRNEILKTRLAI